MAQRTTYLKMLNYALANSPWDVASAVLGIAGVAFVAARPAWLAYKHKAVEEAYLADPSHAYLAERYPGFAKQVKNL